ncbi:hypothetical protein BP5796_00266 [Coleophoma crateriformis]|uniref:Hydrophobin n=1 Tax=Coleophoma crateriformis TaxID=565419 RepID=A0A3D8T7G1_9HELO|nr:hypothetical protein BP5796_00266 [Coleophoma crateriformis]
MRTSFVSLFALSGLFASTLAMPATLLDTRQAGICSSGSATPLCCDVDVLGVADLDCSTPPTPPANITDFNDICAGIGKIDMCCILPILEQALLCTSP